VAREDPPHRHLEGIRSRPKHGTSAQHRRRRARGFGWHGGEHRAVFVYQIDSYHYLKSKLNRNDFTYGQFGENFTVDGLSDQEVCIGDRYRVGGASFEVTQPRVTCYWVGIRMNEPQMAALFWRRAR
jgi:MOSC domain-containing protein YiiM